jgi:proteasome component ECM29
VNKRVKHHLEIGLPLLELWKMYSEANAAPMVRNFCIVYIEMAFERVQVKVCLFLSSLHLFYEIILFGLE